MTLQQLRYVVETEECGSISDAAERLFIAQPSLSKSIRLLEEELGFALFVRDRKGVQATPQGMEFLCYAKRVLEDPRKKVPIIQKGSIYLPSRFTGRRKHFLLF